jgi:hypothetical protein
MIGVCTEWLHRVDGDSNKEVEVYGEGMSPHHIYHMYRYSLYIYLYTHICIYFSNAFFVTTSIRWCRGGGRAVVAVQVSPIPRRGGQRVGLTAGTLLKIQR